MVGLRVALIAALVVFGTACGRAPVDAGESTSQQSQAQPPIEQPTSAPSSSLWLRYSDSDYQFSITYPHNFTFERLHGVPGTGLLMAYRAVDPIFIGKYPRGQLEIAIYTQDAATVGSWIARHSGPPTSSDLKRYWSPPANQVPVKVRGHDGISFDWTPDIGTRAIHATAFFVRGSYVLVIQWWSVDQTYGVMLQQYDRQMLDDVEA